MTVGPKQDQGEGPGRDAAGIHQGVVELTNASHRVFDPPVDPIPQDAGVDVPLRSSGVPERFLAHAGRGDVLAEIGLTPVEIPVRVSAAPERRTAAGERIRPKENGA